MSEIEKQFFKTFGINPKKQCYYWDCPYSTGEIEKDTPINERDCENCINPDKEVYPQIIDRILLELICILSPYCYPSGKNIQHLKESILEWCIKYREYIKYQVQAIFKEDNEKNS